MKTVYLLLTSILIIVFLILLFCCFYPDIEIKTAPLIVHNISNLTAQLDGKASHPSAMWDGNGWAVVFEYEDTAGNHSVYFLRCDKEGELTEGPTRISDEPENAYTPVLGGNENTYGIAYVKETGDGRQIYFRLYKADNEDPSEETKISSIADSECYSPTLFSWQTDDNSYYGIVWCCEVNSNYSLYFTQVNEEETNNPTPTLIQNSAINAQTPHLIQNDEEYALTWTDKIDEPDNDIYFQRFNNAEDLVDDLPIRVSQDNLRAEHPSCAWNNDSGHYGIAWHNESAAYPGYYYIYFCGVDSTGQVIQGSEKLITTENTSDAKFPSLIRNEDDKEYALAWMDNSRTGSFEITYCSLDSMGNSKEGPYTIYNENISQDAESSEFPVLLRNDEEYAIIWTVKKDGKTDIYYTH